MNKLLYYIITPVVFVLIGWFLRIAYTLPPNSNPISMVKPTPLDKYTIENLTRIYPQITPVPIVIGNLIKTYPKFDSYEYTFSFDPTLGSGPKKTVSGVINVPKGNGPFPIIIMFRGYVDPKEYFMGEGTQPAASVFAANGYITVAPDFLGYGKSDKETTDVFESRFQTYTVAMETLKSVPEIQNWDKKNIFVWAHSNGGQIAITNLEITGATFPTVLWAPVSKPFPYSILYYTDESDDGGKSLRKYLAEFEQTYNTDLYSLTRYINQIKAPIQLNQGTYDEEVPVKWSENLEKSLKEATVSAILIEYPGADHNMRPAWNEVVQNNLKFFNDHVLR